MKLRSLIFAISITMFQCSDFEQTSSVSNPTCYIYNKPIYLLKEDIIDALGHLKYRDMMLSYLGSKYTPIDTVDIFAHKGNHDDFYLHSSKFSAGKSFLYRRGNEYLDYVASFHLHLEPIDSVKTKVTIVTIKPKVVIGKEFWPKGPHFVRPLKYEDVLPSTLEEYEILLKIGKESGEKNMPEIVYPTARRAR